MAEAANSWHEWPDCPNGFGTRERETAGSLDFATAGESMVSQTGI
jgi:hypothetical protein